MKPYYEENDVTIYQGDNRDLLPTLPEKSVHCCVTSPPYFGLRDYGNDAQIGLEKTPDEYVAELVKVFREVRRVLRDDGTLWLNLGDSYAGSWGNYGGQNRGKGESQRPIVKGSQLNQKAYEGKEKWKPSTANKIEGIKPKDLIGIPWMVAFALRADGWYLRQDVIWHKPNPMPESVTDRCTKAHEYVFLLSKSARYYFDSKAIQEPETMKPQRRLTPRKANPNAKVHGMPIYRQTEGGTGGGMRNRRSVWSIPTRGYKGAHFATFPESLITPCVLAGSPADGVVLDPFTGSGTSLKVAQLQGRSAIGIELNSEYCNLAIQRLRQEVFQFATA